ncbi:MAG: hypothetical protein LBT59_22060 [Clostridiales bacterium]|nr:hypothetical protein [Clostridiales bacterium]
MNKLWFRKYNSILICLVIAAISIFVRIPNFERDDFHNSDATWHVLHTLRCYDETPISIHKFLPIVTLGSPEDKGISWGATIPDQYGNYYYTSFSPAGYIAPYLFMKALHIPISLMGLYAFNSLLLVLCFAFAARLFEKLFPTINKNYLWLMTAVVYLFQPEIMQGQGITYWSQSLYQLILLIQLNILFSPYSRKKYVAMLFLTLIGAYTEWTGYCAAIGIALFYLCTDKRKWQSIFKSIGIITIALLAFGLFCLHYLLVVKSSDFTSALIARFLARNVATNTPLWQLWQGYVISFGLLLAVTAIGVFFCLMTKNNRPNLFLRSLINHKWLFIIMIFALAENVIMKQHAVAYSFDRMKAVFIIMGLLYCSIEAIILSVLNADNIINSLRWVLGILSVLAAINLFRYKTINTQLFVFEKPQLAINKTIANELNEKFDRNNSVMVYDGGVRGYLNTLFDRGIYEGRGLVQAIQIAANNGKRYAVALKSDFSYSVNDSTAVDSILDLTDANWTHGVLNNGSILLFAENPLTRSTLLEQTPTTLILDKIEYTIVSVDIRPNGYIGITMADHETALKFAYPTKFEIRY